MNYLTLWCEKIDAIDEFEEKDSHFPSYAFRLQHYPLLPAPLLLLKRYVHIYFI